MQPGYAVPETRPPAVAKALWARLGWPQRLTELRKVAHRASEDNSLRAFVVQRILKPGKIPASASVAQARAIHEWASKHLYYVREAGEFIQDPLDTLKLGFGDCDDMTVFLAAAAESIGLPTRIVLQGWLPTGRSWTSATGRDLPGDPAHVYVEIGAPEQCTTGADGVLVCRIDYRRSDPTATWLRFGKITTRVTRRPGYGLAGWPRQASRWGGFTLAAFAFVALIAYLLLTPFAPRAKG